MSDDPAVRYVLRHMVFSRPGFHCVAAFSSGVEALERISGLEIEALLMDIPTPGMAGVELTRRLLAVASGLKVFVLSDLNDPVMPRQYAEAGAAGYLVKPLSPEQVRAAMMFAMARGEVGQPAPCPLGRDCPRLTRPQQAVMVRLAEGLEYKEIADALKITTDMIRYHAHHLYLALKARTRLEAVRKWEHCLRCPRPNGQALRATIRCR